MLALPHPHDLASLVMVRQKALSRCQASPKNGQRKAPEQLLPVGAGDDGNDIVLATELDDRSDMRSNNHSLSPTHPRAEECHRNLTHGNEIISLIGRLPPFFDNSRPSVGAVS